MSSPNTFKRQGVVVLGSTGSIGVNTLEVVARHSDRFHVIALTASTRVDLMLAQCVSFQPAFAVMADQDSAQALKQKCRAAGLFTTVLCGPNAIAEMAAREDVDIVMAAIVGAAGLAGCMAAARAGKRLLLANKEALVVGGDVFMDAVRTGNATLLPIDSEHSAVFQSLPDDHSSWARQIDKIILTASGGPFRLTAPQKLRDVTPEQACAHPNWVMGRKISVDSATMMNKALEVIEARYLFGVKAAKIEVLIHPQSVIHSMVQYTDNSVVAQLGTPDMKGPIAYGLSWPERIQNGTEPLNFAGLGALTFETMDMNDHQSRFPGLSLAWSVLEDGAGRPAILNAANEVAVDAFLNRRIRFDQIHAVNTEALARLHLAAPNSIDDLLEIDKITRSFAGTLVNSFEQ
jgi:1-deoxy-D-xylulose-5-phosphate reductoisomerase